MHPFVRRLVRFVNKSAAPQPWDLPAAIALDELALGRTDLTLQLGPALQDQAAGDILDSLTFATLVALRRPQRIFEIGTGFGRATTLAALHAPLAEIFTLSLPGNPATGRLFHGQTWAQQIRQLEGDSREFDYTPWHGKMDFVFVDGWHKSPIVEMDTAAAFRLVSPTGWIAWHDVSTDTPDVVRTLCEVPTPGIEWLRGTRYALWRGGPRS
jgi:hypothetical protein